MCLDSGATYNALCSEAKMTKDKQNETAPVSSRFHTRAFVFETYSV